MCIRDRLQDGLTSAQCGQDLVPKWSKRFRNHFPKSKLPTDCRSKTSKESEDFRAGNGSVQKLCFITGLAWGVPERSPWA
eukprot:2179433-Karenia_brevis.AAC.1